MKRNIRYFLMIVGLMLSVGIFAQTTKWRDIYTVKKKDTIFGIANKYGLSLPELAFAIAVSESDGTLDDVVTVACGDGHLAVGNLKQEIVKDRQRILAANHLSKHIELAVQC